MSRALDLLLTTDPVQRLRLSQAGLAMVLLGSGVAAIGYFAVTGVARIGPVSWWGGLTLLGMLTFFGLIRSGWVVSSASISLRIGLGVFGSWDCEG